MASRDRLVIRPTSYYNLKMIASRPTVGGYFRYLLTPFFWPWWAVFSGIASIASWYGVPVTGFTVPVWASLIILTVCFASAFLLLSVVCQGWKLYCRAISQLGLVGIQTSSAYEGEHVVLLSCGIDLPVGTLLELQRTDNGVEVPIALVEVRGINSSAQLQAHPIWFGAGHLKDLMTSTLNLSSVRATIFVSREAAEKGARQLAQDKGSA